MGKQTMGTPCHTWHLQAETKLYRLQTPASPFFRPGHYDLVGLDEFAMGTNAVVAVISYTVSKFMWQRRTKWNAAVHITVTQSVSMTGHAVFALTDFSFVSLDVFCMALLWSFFLILWTSGSQILCVCGPRKNTVYTWGPLIPPTNIYVFPYYHQTDLKQIFYLKSYAALTL
jgi:hypothetical protein